MNAKKSALGRGLDALLDSSNSQNKEDSVLRKPNRGGVADIPLNQIKANPDQPRKDFDKEKLEQLAESIKQQGIIQPITVRKISRDRYELISGERRFRASQLIELKEIPAYVREASNEQALEMALVENIQRQDLNALEIALSYQHLIQDCNISMDDIGGRVGKNRSTVNNYLRLLKLPDNIQSGLRDSKISMGHARALINIESQQDQLLIYEMITAKGLSVRQVEELVRKLQNKEQKQSIKTTIKLPYKYQQFNNKLKKHFGNTVSIKRNAKGKGQLSFEFKSDKELDSIIDKLLNS
jgi:ParB family chromosome partitioning protein